MDVAVVIITRSASDLIMDAVSFFLFVFHFSNYIYCFPSLKDKIVPSITVDTKFKKATFVY